MKIALLISSQVKTAFHAIERAEAIATAKDQSWSLEMTKYIFDDNSVLAVRNTDFFGFDADDAESINAYAAWLSDDANDADEAVEIARLLELVQL